MNTALRRLRDRRTGAGGSPGVLLDRIGFAGQQRLVDEESRASSTRPSAGTRSPAASSTTSPGTTPLTGTSLARRRADADARTATDWRSRSAARAARHSWTKSRVTAAARRCPITMSEPATSPVAPLITLAPSRTRTSGLRKCPRYYSHSGSARRLTNRFGPERASRSRALSDPRPVGTASRSVSVLAERRAPPGVLVLRECAMPRHPPRE